MGRSFAEQLLDCWRGNLFQSRKRSITHCAVTPSTCICNGPCCTVSEQHWDLVQVALTDITARKEGRVLP